ncbi:MAG: hypothetical protein LBJ67_01525 [Planctomycetaceae bacterium]|jgi:pimeloyl-ACP methyl ester carboxylesterase|nr:hypothetical protein [Planctomycetaceae bacterium]
MLRFCQSLRTGRWNVTSLLTVAVCWAVSQLLAAAENEPPKFDGVKAAWHGFDRYDFIIDESTNQIAPFQTTAQEGDGIGGALQGKRRCVVVLPKSFAAGRSWSWRGCYWNHEPQTEIELLKRGFAIAHITGAPDKYWETWYDFLVEKHGFSPKPAFIGMSRGGEFSYTWAVRHPDKAACIYADNPGSNPEVFSGLGKLATQDVPLLHINGSVDPLLNKISGAIENIYHALGGRITVVIKEGAGHHPHSLRNPKFAADFIEKSVNEKRPPKPNFVPERFTKTSYYSAQSFYKEFPDEHNYMICRGADFTPVYDRYEFSLPGVEGSIQVVVPNQPAQNGAWVFRATFLDRNEWVDQTLLENGFAIVTGSIPYNADGARLPHWNIVYKYLTEHGFSAKPVAEGTGGAASEAIGWAIAHPDKTACVYLNNPLLRWSFLLEKPIKGHLRPMIDAKIPIVATTTEDAPFNDLPEIGVNLLDASGLKEYVQRFTQEDRENPDVVKFILDAVEK